MPSANDKGTRARRVLVKLSGEALMADAGHGIDPTTVQRFARDIAQVRESGVEVAVVVGGGNIFRGMAAAVEGLDRTTADSMGMLATVMNGLALAGALSAQGCEAAVLSAIPMDTVCEPYARRRAVTYLGQGKVVIFVAGTGNPFFTTDTAAVLRAVESDCDTVYKATQVDGIYSADPKTHSDATRYDMLTYDEVLARDLKVMDGAAVAIARDNKLPVVVFSLAGEGAIARAVSGEGRSTTVSA
ncbi:UMP kinase [Tepidamorphus sp. 3E244]|uniref:UMP kinase n=1 Tax=Tepidamorphus sp. 3E244 TaxID=3385498 RepID=UPI0038FCE544